MRAPSPKRQLAPDVALAVLFLGVCAFELAHHAEDGPYLGSRWTSFALDVPFCSALALRRTRPRTCLVAVNVLWLVPSLLTWHTPLFLGNFLPMLLVAYSAARWTAPPWSRWSWVSGIVFWAGMQPHAGHLRHLVANPVLPVACGVVAWLAGTVLRRLAEQEQRLATAYADLERAQAGREQRAAERERTRIAADMHDTVASAVSLMVVQVGGARLGLEADGEEQPTLRRAEQVGRDALVELRRSLGVLRGATTATAAEPSPQVLEPRARRAWIPPALLDLALALGFAGVAVLESLDAGIDDGYRGGAPVLGAFLGAAFGVPLAWRRRSPRAAYAVMLVVACVPALVVARSFFLYAGLVPLCIACATLTRRDDGWLARTTWLAGPLVTSVTSLHVPEARGPVDLAFGLTFTGAAWATGRTVRRLDRQRAELHTTLTALAEEQADREDAAVEEERSRIAAEVHDVVAHAVSSMVVQVGAARMTTRDAARAETLRQAEETGREALAELRTTLGLLRHDEDAQLRPLPGLGGLRSLAEGFRSAGLDLDLQVSGPDDLPDSAGLTTYRLLQECLTNALKHGGRGRVVARVDVQPGRVCVHVENPLGRGPSRLPSGGHGLGGMRERVSLFSGELEAGRQGDRYVVDAVLRLVREPVLS